MMDGSMGVAGKRVQRVTAGPQGESSAVFGYDYGVCLEVGSPGGQAPTCLLVCREATGILEWWTLDPQRPVIVTEAYEEPEDLDHA